MCSLYRSVWAKHFQDLFLYKLPSFSLSTSLKNRRYSDKLRENRLVIDGKC